MKWVTNTNEKTTEWRLTFNRTKFFFYNFQNLIFLNKSNLNSDLLIENIETAEMLYQRKKILVGEFQPQHSYLIFFWGGGRGVSKSESQAVFTVWIFATFFIQDKIRKAETVLNFFFTFVSVCLRRNLFSFKCKRKSRGKCFREVVLEKERFKYVSFRVTFLSCYLSVVQLFFLSYFLSGI